MFHANGKVNYIKSKRNKSRRQEMQEGGARSLQSLRSIVKQMVPIQLLPFYTAEGCLLSSDAKKLSMCPANTLWIIFGSR